MLKDKLRNKLQKSKLIVFDFDGIFTDGFVYLDQDGKETVRCSRRDSLGIDMLKAAGLKIIVISRKTNPVVEMRCQKMKIKCFSGIRDKLETLKKIVNQSKISPEEICYIGDDITDLECITFAGVGITVNNAPRELKNRADYITSLNGGDHAVREICDLIIKAKEKK